MNVDMILKHQLRFFRFDLYVAIFLNSSSF
jgi:hypothetical protein